MFIILNREAKPKQAFHTEIMLVKPKPMCSTCVPLSACTCITHTHTPLPFQKREGGHRWNKRRIKSSKPNILFCFQKPQPICNPPRSKTYQGQNKVLGNKSCTHPIPTLFPASCRNPHLSHPRACQDPQPNELSSWKSRMHKPPPIRQAPTAPPGAKFSSSTLLQEGGGAGSKRSLPAQQSAVAF